MIYESERVPQGKQRPTFGDEMLEDQRILSVYKIQEDDTIHMVLRLRGAEHYESDMVTQSLNVPNRSRFTCEHLGCLKDMCRHALSHNADPPHFCPHAGCPRETKGFLRRENLQAHLEAHYDHEVFIDG